MRTLFFLLFKRDPIPEFTEVSCSEVQPGYCLSTVRLICNVQTYSDHVVEY